MLLNVNTTCLTCKFFDCTKTIDLKGSPQLVSLGICKIWCHKVHGDEFCSRGKYDSEWTERRKVQE